MRPSLRKIVLATLPTLLAVPIWTTAASGAVLSCGQTVTQSTVLDNDLLGCTNNGIIIGADNITLDLNGHTVAGTPNTGDQAGVALVGRSGVTVRNGTVRAFDVGVVIEGGSGNTVQNIQAVNNISFETAPRRGGDGIAILSSRNNRILQNSTVNNGPYSGIGIYSDVDSAHPRATGGVSSGNVIDSNIVQGNIQGRTPNNVVNNDNIGIRLEPGNTANSILNNRVDGNGLDGITLFVRNTFTTVRGNVVSGNGFYRQTARRGNGIGLQIGGANDNLVENNFVTRNADNGISIRNGSLRNTVRNNTAVGNVVLPPASQNFGPTFDLLDNNPDCDANLWRDNRYGTVFPACAADTP
ncbi:MAG TPA: right-handed parallel beta-helix repeat-containing protein [Acidimicrobiales bacterium]|nr:right-handed parallel beta-helix repeat-containing protein [Acidimicrobiales bacterium]